MILWDWQWEFPNIIPAIKRRHVTNLNFRKQKKMHFKVYIILALKREI